MAMATMQTLQRLPTLQQSWSRAHPVLFLKQSTISSSQLFCSETSKSSISLLSLTTTGVGLRGRIPCRAKVGDEGIDSTQETENTSVAPGKSRIGGAKGFGASPKDSVSQKKKSSKSTASSGSIRRAPPSKPLIGVQSVDPQTQQIETAVVASLAFLFAVILLEGLVLAASGFLPEEWDQFAVKILYPAFTPSVGIFFSIAVGYGVWKYLGGGAGTRDG